MRVRAVIGGLLTLLILLSGCGRQPAEAPRPEAAASEGITAAQQRLITLKTWLGKEELSTEIAVTEMQLRTGMMFRKEMGDSEAMLFVFSGASKQGFWMKNTYVPLSCAYIDPEGVIQEIHDMKPHDTNSVDSASTRIQYVLEVNQGWFSRHQVTTGMVLQTERGGLSKTFFNR